MDILIREVLAYDPETGNLLWKKPVGKKIKSGDIAGSFDKTTGYVRLKLRGRRLLAHRVVWFLHNAVWPKGVIDHINRNKTDNRLCNLRDTTVGENTRNSERFQKDTTGVFKSGKDRWAARITINRKTKFLGTFDSLIKARSAYLLAAENT